MDDDVWTVCVCVCVGSLMRHVIPHPGVVGRGDKTWTQMALLLLVGGHSSGLFCSEVAVFCWEGKQWCAAGFVARLVECSAGSGCGGLRL